MRPFGFGFSKKVNFNTPTTRNQFWRPNSTSSRRNGVEAYYDYVAGKRVAVNVILNDPVPSEKLAAIAHFSHSPANVLKYNLARQKLFLLNLPKGTKALEEWIQGGSENKEGQENEEDVKDKENEDEYMEKKESDIEFEDDPIDNFDRAEEATLISNENSIIVQILNKFSDTTDMNEAADPEENQDDLEDKPIQPKIDIPVNSDGQSF